MKICSVLQTCVPFILKNHEDALPLLPNKQLECTYIHSPLIKNIL